MPIRAIQRRREAWFWPMPFGTDDPVLVQEALAATYGMIEYVDSGVGRVLAALDHLGIGDETIVIFTSDHGDMMGEHGLMLKGNLHYQGVIRVPLTISAPGYGPGRSSSLASSLDLAPTVLHLCGVERFDGIQGTTLQPVLERPAATVRDSLLIEDDLPSSVVGVLDLPAKMRTIVTDTHRYTRDSNGDEQLFDLVADPDELDNRSGSDTATRNGLRDAMVDALIAAGDVSRGVPVDRCP